MQFEWDEVKEKKNIEKHGISFKTASMVFLDEQRLEFFDEVHSSYEDRYITIGFAGKVLMVVYTFRNPLYRIISARIATEKERRVYLNGYKKI
ncbi:BrnT family toxin [Oribacterium parvum]|jgi:protein of hypothetical function DUF497|uniref:BrnT family toxin n=1 Tax=Oribacterium parvum TaxID=1501329 RepID=UPI0028E5C7A8|nr:BrnT family toxin [Oribacterium parvum]